MSFVVSAAVPIVSETVVPSVLIAICKLQYVKYVLVIGKMVVFVPLVCETVVPSVHDNVV